MSEPSTTTPSVQGLESVIAQLSATVFALAEEVKNLRGDVSLIYAQALPAGNTQKIQELDPLQPTSKESNSNSGINGNGDVKIPPPVKSKGLSRLPLDLTMMTAMQLRERYPAEARSHDSRKAACKRTGAKFDFPDFRAFLIELGPMPQPGMTCDRAVNLNRNYGPGLVRWADKSTQNNNKGDTRLFTGSDGSTYTTAQLAKMHGVQTSAIRKRDAAGWSHDENIAGHRFPAIVTPHKPSAGSVRTFGRVIQLDETELRRREELESFRRGYAEYGLDATLAPPEVIFEDACPKIMAQSERRYRIKFGELWKRLYRHVIPFSALTDRMKAIVREVDPKAEEREIKKAEMLKAASAKL